MGSLGVILGTLEGDIPGRNIFRLGLKLKNKYQNIEVYKRMGPFTQKTWFIQGNGTIYMEQIIKGGQH